MQALPSSMLSMFLVFCRCSFHFFVYTKSGRRKSIVIGRKKKFSIGKWLFVADLMQKSLFYECSAPLFTHAFNIFFYVCLRFLFTKCNILCLSVISVADSFRFSICVSCSWWRFFLALSLSSIFNLSVACSKILERHVCVFLQLIKVVFPPVALYKCLQWNVWC